MYTCKDFVNIIYTPTTQKEYFKHFALSSYSPE